MEGILAALFGVLIGFLLQQWWEAYKSDRALLRGLQSTLLAMHKLLLSIHLADAPSKHRDPTDDLWRSLDADKLRAEYDTLRKDISLEAWQLQGGQYARLTASIVLLAQKPAPNPGQSLLKEFDPILKELGETLNQHLLHEVDRQQKTTVSR